METVRYTVSPAAHGVRLDRLLTDQLPQHSRTFCKELITQEAVLINGIHITKPSWPVKTGDCIEITFPQVSLKVALPLPAEGLGAELLYEHDEFLIVYKPAGLVVHAPHTESTEATLVDWLINTFSTLSNIGPTERPGIVHRLDKDTSGILIIPRTNTSHAQFAEMFEKRLIEKTYQAFVKGFPPQEGTIDLPIGRHPILRHKMGVTSLRGKASLTSYRVLSYHDEYTLLELRPTTGRTHQIRVHCAAMGHSLLGDETYGSSSKYIKRHALHAYQLAFTYKETWYSFTYDMPQDMKALLTQK